jgi:carbon storage regulator
MLVLTRRVGEEIVINGDIRIKVLMSKGDRVRLGITAPESVRVDRQEVHERRSEFAGEKAAAFDRVAKTPSGKRLLQRKLVAVASAFCEPFDKISSTAQGIS